jgi:two-component system response regulator PilR (NtrC family)
VKLLRAIQEKAVRPLGVEKEVPVDVRLITATHKNLAEEVREGRFRDDLYYRINVIDLFIPPLRHRRADIPLIARHILLKMADGTKSKPLSLSKDAIELLKQHEFRGNIRELENILARAAALLDGDRIERHNLDLSPGPRQTASQGAALTPEIPQAPSTQEHHHLGDLDSYLAQVEREILEDTLQRHRWNRAATAKALGINLRSLRYRLKKLDIEV